jgi:hypothetical protein
VRLASLIARVLKGRHSCASFFERMSYMAVVSSDVAPGGSPESGSGRERGRRQPRGVTGSSPINEAGSKRVHSGHFRF